MKCIFCDGEDVHECPGGTCDVRGDTTFSLGGTGTMNVYPGKVDARAYQPPKYETRLSIDRLLAEARHKPRVNMNCPNVGCTRPDCDGNHEVHGPCMDAPRGGFEFL